MSFISMQIKPLILTELFVIFKKAIAFFFMNGLLVRYIDLKMQTFSVSYTEIFVDL